MSASVLYMSMSLDGYIAGPNDSPNNPGSDDFDTNSGDLRRLIGHPTTTLAAAVAAALPR
jgi:hypothetical protein